MTRAERIKRRRRERMIVFTVWTVLVAIICGVVGRVTAPVEVETKEVIKYVEVQEEHLFDNSIIEDQWCKGVYTGKVRTLGGWWYTDGVVEDEQGNLWDVECEVTTEDFLLLWIIDNDTPTNYADDEIIKVWREAR